MPGHKISKKDIKKYLKTATELALATGKILTSGFNQRKTIKFKGRIDPVTNIDIKADKFISSKIISQYPDHNILTEEATTKVNHQKSSLFRWIIDPIDGTVNYSHKYPVYAVSIALEFNGNIIVGVVYDPQRDELFSSASGMGAYLNGKKINVSKEHKLERSLLATGFSYEIATLRKNNLGLFARMAKKVQGIRRTGSAALDLCWLACGRIDGYWELYLFPWDVAGGWLIVEEAKGKVTGIDGKKYSLSNNHILASNKLLHSKLSSSLNQKR